MKFHFTATRPLHAVRPWLRERKSGKQNGLTALISRLVQNTVVDSLKVTYISNAGTSEWPTLMSPDQMGVFVGSGCRYPLLGKVVNYAMQLP